MNSKLVKMWKEELWRNFRRVWCIW